MFEPARSEGAPLAAAAALPGPTPTPTQGSESSNPMTKKKICCACPKTKRARDECVAERGQEAEECRRLIEAHKACLRSEGFRV
eukprot:SM000159S01792  [mRNA]  locus=s159:227376:227992:- [translate_table: standard]